MPIQYMTTEGVFIGSYGDDTPCEVEGAVIAPNGGCDGMRWDGSAWVEHSPAPDTCTALQGRLALGEARCAQIAVMLPGLPWASRQAWEYATTWHRESPLIRNFAAAFSLTEAQVDDLFRLAVTLEV